VLKRARARMCCVVPLFEGRARENEGDIFVLLCAHDFSHDLGLPASEERRPGLAVVLWNGFTQFLWRDWQKILSFPEDTG